MKSIEKHEQTRLDANSRDKVFKSQQGLIPSQPAPIRDIPTTPTTPSIPASLSQLSRPPSLNTGAQHPTLVTTTIGLACIQRDAPARSSSERRLFLHQSEPFDRIRFSARTSEKASQLSKNFDWKLMFGQSPSLGSPHTVACLWAPFARPPSPRAGHRNHWCSGMCLLDVQSAKFGRAPAFAESRPALSQRKPRSKSRSPTQRNPRELKL